MPQPGYQALVRRNVESDIECALLSQRIDHRSQLRKFPLGITAVKQALSKGKNIDAEDATDVSTLLQRLGT